MKVATVGDERKRRVNESHVPTGIAAGVFVARRQEYTMVAIEGVDNGLDRSFDRNAFDDTADIDATASAVGINAGDMGCSAGHSSLLHCARAWSCKAAGPRPLSRGGGPEKTKAASCKAAPLTL